MRRPASSIRHSATPAAPRRAFALATAWVEVIRPAIAIAMVGACAVLYLVACARLSVVECDLRRLERIAQDEQARELELHRQFAELGNVEELRSHIVERGLCRPVDVAHVKLTEVPAALYPTLPTGAGDEGDGGRRLGQLPASRLALGTLYAAAPPPQ